MTPAQLHTQIDLRFADNTTQAITPAVLRDFLHDQLDALSAGSLVLPRPQVRVKQKPAMERLLGAYDPNQQRTGYVQQTSRNVVQLHFDQPLSAALLARQPEIWVFRYTSHKKKYPQAEALLQAAVDLFDELDGNFQNDNLPLTQAQVTALAKSGQFLLNWVPGFVYVPYESADPAGWVNKWTSARAANWSRMSARLSAQGGKFKKRRGGWTHVPHQLGSRHAGNFWTNPHAFSGIGGAGGQGPANGYTSEFFDETMRYCLAQYGQWDVNLVPAEWFSYATRPGEGSHYLYHRSGRKTRSSPHPDKAATRLRFVLAVPALAGEASRGGYLFSELSEEVQLSARMVVNSVNNDDPNQALPIFDTEFTYRVLPGTFA